MRSPHVDDWGTPFSMTIYDSTNGILNISSASPITIIFTKPDGTHVEKEAVFVTDGVDGKMKYVTVDGDLSASGLWQYQGRVTFTNGEWATDLISFTVEGN